MTSTLMTRQRQLVSQEYTWVLFKYVMPRGGSNNIHKSVLTQQSSQLLDFRKMKKATFDVIIPLKPSFSLNVKSFSKIDKLHFTFCLTCRDQCLALALSTSQFPEKTDQLVVQDLDQTGQEDRLPST